MFTLQQIKAAHAKVKSGADFPAYVQEIKKLGLLHYDYFVKDGQTIYHGANAFTVSGDPVYAEKTISVKASPAALAQIIIEHQQGKTDFLTFCRQVADAGVAKWTVDTQAMLCTYFDLAENSMLAEPIPGEAY